MNWIVECIELYDKANNQSDNSFAFYYYILCFFLWFRGLFSSLKSFLIFALHFLKLLRKTIPSQLQNFDFCRCCCWTKIGASKCDIVFSIINTQYMIFLVLFIITSIASHFFFICLSIINIYFFFTSPLGIHRNNNYFSSFLIVIFNI